MTPRPPIGERGEIFVDHRPVQLKTFPRNTPGVLVILGEYVGDFQGFWWVEETREVNGAERFWRTWKFENGNVRDWVKAHQHDAT